MAINGGGLIGISILDGSIGLVLEQPGIFMLLGFRSDIFFLFYRQSSLLLLLKLNKKIFGFVCTQYVVVETKKSFSLSKSIGKRGTKI